MLPVSLDWPFILDCPSVFSNVYLTQSWIGNIVRVAVLAIRWTHELAKGKQFLPLTRRPPCYSHSQDVFDTTMHKQKQIRKNCFRYLRLMSPPFDLKVKYLFLNSIFLPGPYHFCLVVVVQMAALRGDISLRYLKQFFLICRKTKMLWPRQENTT
jgi:hypothetical protein